ncbi:hypothetical protein N8E89_22260 (plasmid) [Phyllobacterium sp. A18/5-2]|uniref:hypothetical protein n=1 Tax=Phyllobacterium sp. A18/5-2 TaxID=2978392 RepID=UPI0021C9C401|nr:hypothetical protein [Phyllobacterium sp. A18/5-2]UXN67214.1 hypothetical protein N8E89_22260 [Phyllobacterium sp. A18/5-2]
MTLLRPQNRRPSGLNFAVLETEGLLLAMISDDGNHGNGQNLALVVRHYHGLDLDEAARRDIAVIEQALAGL